MSYEKRLPKNQRRAIKSTRRFAKQIGDRYAERHLVEVKQGRETREPVNFG